MVGSDFEDNLLITTALLVGLDAIVTRDPRGFSGSPIAALSPAVILTKIREPGVPSDDPN